MSSSFHHVFLGTYAFLRIFIHTRRVRLKRKCENCAILVTLFYFPFLTASTIGHKERPFLQIYIALCTVKKPIKGNKDDLFGSIGTTFPKYSGRNRLRDISRAKSSVFQFMPNFQYVIRHSGHGARHEKALLDRPLCWVFQKGFSRPRAFGTF